MVSNVAAFRRVPLACAILAALFVPTVASAQSSKESEQDARIQQLEAELQSLKQALLQQQDQISQERSQREAELAARPPVQPGAAPLSGPGMQGSGAVAARPAPPAGKPRAPIQDTAIVSGDSHFSYGGFIKLDMMSTRTSDGTIADGTPGRMFYFPTATPVGGKGDSYTDFHAQFSRIWFGVDRVTDAGDTVKGYVEFDFFGGGNSNVGNEKFSNGYPPTLRHAYVQWNRWTAGQTWTNFMDLGSVPETVDFVGIVDGTVFARQAQLRYTRGPWSFSLENPQTWYQAGSPAHVSSGENTLPDVTARWQTKGDWGHFSVAGLARELRTGTDKTQGYALSVAGSFKLGERDLLQYTFSGGPGLGRYIGFGMAPDAYLDGNGDLEAQDLYAGFAAWRHNWNGSLRSTLAYSAAYIDNDPSTVGALSTRRTQSWRANLIYSPFPRLDLGAEVSWAKREVAGGLEGELARLHTTVKYTF